MLNKSSKTWLFLLILSAIVWLGAINVRFIIGGELLNYDEFDFRTSIPPDEENMIFKLISNASIVLMIAYFFTFIFAVLFLKTCKINLKQNAWFLMCAILFFVFSPVEFYTSYLDLKFTLLFVSGPPNHDELLRLFGERIGFLKGVPAIAVLSYYTIIGIAIFRPLKKTKKELEEDKLKTDEHSYKYYLHEDDDIIMDK